jgi:hypothetical protein
VLGAQEVVAPRMRKRTRARCKRERKKIMGKQSPEPGNDARF